jgi:hypothetical protein
VTHILREADDHTKEAKEAAWERWMERYLRLRITDIPVALGAEESGAMCEWVVVLKSHYVEILQLLLSGPSPT